MRCPGSVVRVAGHERRLPLPEQRGDSLPYSLQNASENMLVWQDGKEEGEKRMAVGVPLECLG